MKLKLTSDPAGLPGIYYDAWYQMTPEDKEKGWAWDRMRITSSTAAMPSEEPLLIATAAVEIETDMEERIIAVLEEFSDSDEDTTEYEKGSGQELDEGDQFRHVLPAAQDAEDDGIPVLYPEAAVDRAEDTRPAIDFIQVVLT